ncbi:MAG TPA: chemotaxis response regulator protein-glutamate methylesterase [Nitrospirae bacterium]|nr:chemotaxis response regulator protein-glutamate methylesterase [bacterium BMS3Abin10]GBE38740.1 chemotaxis response regulator protein-glutamate methylesterase [bacterium BMS3Bbin08]HDH51474.1 chemotaxis response regulator protein-glutamate methylesterase [Nitrospirota bacterium]HDK16685.1 chemotaxis response regulator protein-glutamate methylesterase [Nitrospirota bacterium]HDK82311.1 chemotaxis response regulator protein-glutamate methylesterase [Nitrospirota bacterium]
MPDEDLKPIKVLVVDDSAFSRQTIKTILQKVPNVEIVGVAVNGQDGMRKIINFKPDVVTLDLEMPEMDGFTLLRWVMQERPLPVIVVSSHGDDPTVFKALELGAVDVVIKPTARASRELKEIESDLIRKVVGASSLQLEKLKRSISLLEKRKVINGSDFSGHSEIKMVAVGSSTGGPTALQSILTRLPGNFPSMIVISQHMPRGFTRQFADRMDKLCALYVKEADQGEPIEAGKVLICPGGYHLMFQRLKGKIFVLLKESATSDRYIPSVDIMMKSIAEVYGPRTMGVLLTGMGNDGKEGMLEIKKQGGFTIAESEETAVVFGMPREIILAGGADKIAPLEKIPDEIMKRMKRDEKQNNY